MLHNKKIKDKIYKNYKCIIEISKIKKKKIKKYLE